MQRGKSAEQSEGLSYVVQLYSGLALLSLGIFGTLHLLEGNTVVGYAELLGSVIFSVNLLVLFAARKIAFAKNVFLFTVLAFLILMLVSGGTEKTGIFWYFVFPVTSFFLAGKRQGLWWMLGLFAVTAGTWLLATAGMITIAYDNITIRQLLISVLVVGLGIYVYQWWRENLEHQTKESQRELHTERVRADVIIQNIDEGIVTTDTEGKVTFMNHAAEQLLGWKQSDLVGQVFVEKVPLLDKAGKVIPLTSQFLQKTVKAAGSISAVVTYQRKDGSTIPVSVTGMPIEVEGAMTGVITTFRDISEEQHVARTKSEFVTLASHQLRTPISAISWVSELLLHGDAGKLSQEQHDHIADIYHSNQRMANLVSEMLIVSSLDLESLPVQPKATNLAELAAKAVKDQRDRHPEATAQITEDYDPDLPQLQADPEVAGLIFGNLISNALKYTPADGQVIIKISQDPDTKLSHSSKGSLVITVRDSGYGIPQSASSKIFSKFFRAANITHKDTDGTGLGLYIVKSLLDYVGGRISFSSHEGKGTTFTVHLPLEGMTKHDPIGQSLGPTTTQSLLRAKEVPRA